MPTIDPSILKQARKDSGMSQSQLAKNLDISQTQVSRYEKNPDSIPAGLFAEWTGMFGLSPADVLKESSDTSLEVKPGDPYRDFHTDLDLVSRYVETQAPEALESLSEDTGQVAGAIPSAEDLEARIRELRQKPNVMTAGGFDTGKSYLANTLMGEEVLPTSYQPATRVVTIVRHVDDRPEWQDEDVWLFEEDLWEDDGGEPVIDISRLSERSCEKHRVLAGSHDLLGKYGVHRSEPTEKVKQKMEEAHSAVVYVDAPILKACNIVDLPGFGDRPSGESKDQEKARAALPFADVVLYASRIGGHLSGKDLARISALLQRLPAPESKSEDFPTLGSLFLVGTHADRNVSDSETTSIKEGSTRRLHRYLEDGALPRYEKRAGREVTVEDFRAQWFPFWAEDENRSRPLVDRLEDILGRRLPEVKVQEKQKQLEDLRQEVEDRCGHGADLYREAAEESSQQQGEVEELIETAGEQKHRLQEKRGEVEELIGKLKKKSKARVQVIVRHFTGENGAENVEKLIRQNFDDKSEAKDRAPTLIVEKIESDIEKEIDELNDELIEEVDEYLGAFEKLSVQAEGEDEMTVPFDARGTFAGGLASVGAAGGLAAWAAQLGSLGGYAIVAQGVGALSTLGISISGGAAAATAWVAAAGGPVTLGAAVAGVAGLAGWRLMSRDWEERLARKIAKHYKEEGLEDQFRGGVKEYWEDTQAAFEAGANSVEEEFQNYLSQLEQLTEKEEEALTYAERFEEARDFYSGMPV